MDTKNYLQQCKRVIARTSGSPDVTVEEVSDGVRSLAFTTIVNMGGRRRSCRPTEIQFKFHVKEPLRQVVIYSKPIWSLPMSKIIEARSFVTQANHRLNVGSLDLDACGDVSFKTAAEFGGINDISPVLASLFEAHTSSGMDCFRALESIKDQDAKAQDVVSFISRRGTSAEGVDDQLSKMLSVLAQPTY